MYGKIEGHFGGEEVKSGEINVYWTRKYNN